MEMSGKTKYNKNKYNKKAVSARLFFELKFKNNINEKSRITKKKVANINENVSKKDMGIDLLLLNIT